MPKVLIIEDRRENIVFIANNILKPRGYDVVTAMDGQTGLSKAQEEKPDMIITDLKLPRLGGLEVMEQLAAKGVHIPTIVMTFHGSEETAVKAFRLGACDYLVKPFSMEDMEAALARAAAQATQAVPAAPEKPKTEPLEQELIRMRAILARREIQLQQMQKQLTEAKRPDQADSPPRVSALEEENARLTQALGQCREIINAAEGRIKALEEIIKEQKGQMSKYQRETRRLAEELRNLTEAVRLMSQDLDQQMKRLDIFSF